MAKAASQKNYKQMSTELDELTAWFEQPNIDVDEAIKKYEQAMALIKDMETHLKTAEVKLTKLNQRFDA